MLCRRIEMPIKLGALVIACCTFLTISGCMPEAPPLDGQLSFKKANQELFGMHAKHGAIYVSEHVLDGKPFKANWELANYMKKAAMVQVKPPTDTFTEVDLVLAVEMALEDVEHNPWHQVANDAIMNTVIQATAADDDETGWGLGYCPDAPYEVSCKIKKNGAEWFCEIRVQNEFDPEKLAEAAEAAQDALDRLEAQHAND